MVVIGALNLLMTIALAVVGVVLYNHMNEQWAKIRKQDGKISGIEKKIEADKYNLIETWNHAEKAVLKSESNARNIHDLETAVRKLQGWVE